MEIFETKIFFRNEKKITFAMYDCSEFILDARRGHPYFFLIMWIVSWIFGVIVVSVIPIILRLYIYYSNYIAFDALAIQSLDIALMGLAYNWFNITETTIIYTKENVIYKKILGGILLFSLVVIIGLTLVLHDLNANDILELHDKTEYNLHIMPLTCILTGISLLMNIAATILIKGTKNGKL